MHFIHSHKDRFLERVWGEQWLHAASPKLSHITTPTAPPKCPLLNKAVINPPNHIKRWLISMATNYFRNRMIPRQRYLSPFSTHPFTGASKRSLQIVWSNFSIRLEESGPRHRPWHYGSEAEEYADQRFCEQSKSDSVNTRDYIAISTRNTTCHHDTRQNVFIHMCRSVHTNKQAGKHSDGLWVSTCSCEMLPLTQDVLEKHESRF